MYSQSRRAYILSLRRTCGAGASSATLDLRGSAATVHLVEVEVYDHREHHVQHYLHHLLQVLPLRLCAPAWGVPDGPGVLLCGLLVLLDLLCGSPASCPVFHVVRVCVDRLYVQDGQVGLLCGLRVLRRVHVLALGVLARRRSAGHRYDHLEALLGDQDFCVLRIFLHVEDLRQVFFHFFHLDHTVVE